MKKFLLNIWYTILFQFDNHRDELPEWWYEENNIPLEYHPKAKLRMAVAQDIIDQVYMQKFVPNSGSYLRFLDTENAEYKESVKDNFEKIRECHVCAIGACLLSAIKFKNSFTFADLEQVKETEFFLHSDKVHKLLSIFSPQQLLLIETAFERSEHGSKIARKIDEYVGTKISNIHEAERFGRRHEWDSNRMIAIMENIIENKGEFKP
jgi:hypothetical protein